MSGNDPFLMTLHQWIDLFMRRSHQNFIRYARESGLSLSQLGVLFHLNNRGCSGVTDLGDYLGVTSAAASQLLDRLVAQELILRSEDPNDRRVKQITLTDKGCQILKEGVQVRSGWVDALENNLTDLEKEQAIRALKTLIKKVEQLEPFVEEEIHE
jgi:DNA-binding MarR family transcriptional regulator